MLRLTWFLLRAALWLALAGLFAPGLLPRETTTASHIEFLGEKTSQDTLTPFDRVASWRGPRTKN